VPRTPREANIRAGCDSHPKRRPPRQRKRAFPRVSRRPGLTPIEPQLLSTGCCTTPTSVSPPATVCGSPKLSPVKVLSPSTQTRAPGPLPGRKEVTVAAETSSRNDGTTTCGACGRPFDATRRRTWCSPSCRVGAWRCRRTPEDPQPPLPPERGRRGVTVYVCEDCDVRTLGDQRCPKCNRFMRGVGLGGTCPCCDAPVAAAELSEGGGR
jgi:hypothetical protein